MFAEYVTVANRMSSSVFLKKRARPSSLLPLPAGSTVRVLFAACRRAHTRAPLRRGTNKAGHATAPPTAASRPLLRCVSSCHAWYSLEVCPRAPRHTITRRVPSYNGVKLTSAVSNVCLFCVVVRSASTQWARSANGKESQRVASTRRIKQWTCNH